MIINPILNTPNSFIINGSTTIASKTIAQPTNISCDGTISASEVIVDGISVKETLQKINERLLILEPKKELVEKYTALKVAYDHYIMLEKMLSEPD